MQKKEQLPHQLPPLVLDAEPECAEAYKRELYSYMLGGDMVVCPVVEQGALTRRVWLPAGEWVHLWSGETFERGSHTVGAPMGEPPVFYRAESMYAELFREISGKFALST